MKAASRPAWFRMATDVAIALAIVIGAIYVLAIEAGAAEEQSLADTKGSDSVQAVSLSEGRL